MSPRSIELHKHTCLGMVNTTTFVFYDEARLSAKRDAVLSLRLKSLGVVRAGCIPYIGMRRFAVCWMSVCFEHGLYR